MLIHRIDSTQEENEDATAAYIERLVAAYDDRKLGPRDRRDGKGGLRVDYVYDEAEPAVALEITALVRPDVAALDAELQKLEAEVGAVIEAEKLGGWMVAFAIGTPRKQIQPLLIEFLRSQRDGEPAQYDQSEAPDDIDDAALAMLVELLSKGLVSATRLSHETDGIDVFPPVSVGISPDRGSTTLLRGAIAANLDKLREAVPRDGASPRETHLVVDAGPSPFSSDPSLTPAPLLPDGLDVLWVIVGYYNAKHTYRVWRTIGDGRWELLASSWPGEDRAVHPPETRASAARQDGARPDF